MTGALGLALLAAVALGAPLLLFEFSLQQARRRSRTGLRLEACATAQGIELRWRPLPVAPTYIAGYLVQRESEPAGDVAEWWLTGPSHTLLIDSAARAGRAYRYRVRQQLIGGGQRTSALEASVSLTYAPQG